MARLRVLGENPPPPRGNGENQLRELRDYLTRLKDELEFLMTHLGEDNFAESLATWVTDTSKTVESINKSISDINGEIGDINTALAGKQDTLTFDDTPTSGSDNPVKSGGVYSALSGKQNTLTFDNSPTSGSDNPVKSGGIYTALETKPTMKTINLTAGQTVTVTLPPTANYGAYSMLMVGAGTAVSQQFVAFAMGRGNNASNHTLYIPVTAANIAITDNGSTLTVQNTHGSWNVYVSFLVFYDSGSLAWSVS